MNMNRCDLCENTEFAGIFSGCDYSSVNSDVFNVVKCNRCGLISLSNQPENLMVHYDSYRKENLSKDYFMFLSPDRTKMVGKYKSTGKILDIGCGTGGFLVKMMKKGWDVFGCDISADACSWAQEKVGLKNIINNDVSELNFPDNYFDVITLWHVLEHSTKPKESLLKINRLLKNDGILIVESPNYASLQSRFFRGKWFQLDLPRHLYHFHPKVLEKMLKMAGFRILKRDWIVDPRITFIDLKISLLRYLKVYRIPEKEIPQNTKSLENGNLIKKIVYLTVNLMFVMVSLIFVMINSDSSFRIYCQKEGMK